MFKTDEIVGFYSTPSIAGWSLSKTLWFFETQSFDPQPAVIVWLQHVCALKICQRRSADFWGFMSGRFLNDVRRYIQHWSKYNHTGIDMEKSNRKQWNLFFWTSFHIHPYSIPEWLPKWPKFSELPQKHLWHRGPSHTDYSSFCTWNFTQETPIPSTKKQVHIIPKW